MQHTRCCQAAWLVVAVLAATTHAAAAANRRLWDAGWNVSYTPFPSINQTLMAVDMQHMQLYPASTLPFVPAAYDLLTIPNNARLRLINCTIVTTSDVFNSYFLFSENLGINDAAIVITSDLEASFTIKKYTMQLSVNITTGQQLNLTIAVDNLLMIYADISETNRVVPTAYVNSSAALRSAMSSLALIGEDGAITIQGQVTTSPTSGWPASGYVWQQVDTSVPPSLLISGMDSSTATPSTLDLSMSSNLISIPQQTVGNASVTLKALTLTNMCLEHVILTSSYYFPVSFMMAAFGGDITIAVNDTILLVPEGELDMSRFWAIMTSSPFTQIQRLAAGSPISVTLHTDSWNLSSSDLHITQLATPRGLFSNVTYRSMQASSEQLLQPQYCSVNSNGQAGLHGVVPSVPPALFNVKSTLDDAWQTMIDAGADRSQEPIWPFVILTQHGNAAFSGLLSFELSRDVLWIGYGSLPSSTAQLQLATVNLQRLAGVVTLQGSSTLYLQRLTLTNLTTGVVPGQAGNVTSAVLLPAFQFPRGAASGSPQVVMSDVQLVVPVDSYAPLYALATIGGVQGLAAARQAYPNWMTLQHPVLDGMLLYTVSWFNESGILLANYTGWGCSALGLLISPDQTFINDYDDIHGPFPWLMPSPPATSPAPNNSSSLTIAVVVGVVVGVLGTLLIIALVWLFCRYRRRKQCEAHQLADMEKAAAYAMVQMQPLDGKTSQDANYAIKAQDEEPVTAKDSPTITAEHGVAQEPEDEKVQVQPQPQPQPQAPAWDPKKEVEQLVGVVQGQQNETLHLLEPIGTGGFGTVYRGRWRNLDVAVKTVLFQNKHKDTEMGGPERRAIMEAAACSSVVHRNVVATYHYDIKMVSTVTKEGALQIKEAADQASDWKLFLVQELCDVSLADAIEASVFHDKLTRQPKLPLVFAVLQDIAAGMAYIHSKNIIHADLKPENVLLKHSADSQYGVVAKVTDFGLCSTIDPTKSHVSGFNNGTPFYVAPEISMTGRAEKQSDVFSFGILMAEVYRGVPPWVKTVNGFRPNKDFLNFPPSTPQLFVQLVKQCLDRRPKKRPQFTEIADTLKEVFRLLTSAATPPLAAGQQAADTSTTASWSTEPAPGPNTPPVGPGASHLVPPLITSEVTAEALVSIRGSRQLASQHAHPAADHDDGHEADRLSGGSNDNYEAFVNHGVASAQLAESKLEGLLVPNEKCANCLGDCMRV